jgi:hypothetical protein
MMALPVLNSAKYEMTIPSTGETVEYRPFLVKEEKVLLTVLETNDMVQITRALRELINACTFGKVKVEDLAMFDIEYVFLKIRSKSVGENATITLPCSSCEERNEIKINLESVELKGDVKGSKKIQLTPEVGVKMRYPKVSNVERVMKSVEGGEFDVILSLIASSIESIYDAENVYPAADHTPQELIDFIESLNSDQFKMIQDFFNDFPKLEEDVSFTCTKCGTQNDAKLQGLNDFFG